MILPLLCINGSRCYIELYYPEEPNNPIAIFSGQSAKAATDLFGHMLCMAIENYDDGYDIGYNNAVDDMEGGAFDVEI